jgi:NitT/TauT family transport system substrate-binding protein
MLDIRRLPSAGIMFVFSRWIVAGALLCSALAGAVDAACAEAVRVSALKFGTLSWELAVIKSHGLDKAEGIEIEVSEAASTATTVIALQSGAADVIVTDWMWVNRQRAEGAGFTFVPYSTSLGDLMVPPGSAIQSLADLKGKKLGIAGGPFDKSWLILRAFASQRHGIDLDNAVDKVFGAPPLINSEILSGRLDAVITPWNFAADLEAKGYRKVVSVEDAARDLGVSVKVPLLGFVFDEKWAERNQDTIMGLLRASRRAKAILAQSDAEWDMLRPLVKAGDEATFAALRARYRAGIQAHWGESERAAAATLFGIMARLGGEALVGKGNALQPGTFWSAVSY